MGDEGPEAFVAYFVSTTGATANASPVGPDGRFDGAVLDLHPAPRPAANAPRSAVVEPGEGTGPSRMSTRCTNRMQDARAPYTSSFLVPSHFTFSGSR